MSKCVEKLPHKTDTCNSSDALQVFENEDGGYSGFCFSCNTYISDPYEGKPVKPKKRSNNYDPNLLIQIAELPIKDIPHRKLTRETCEYFSIHTAVSEEDGETPTAYFFPFENDKNEIVGYKAKTPDKKIWSIPTIKGSMPFGWRQAVEAGGKLLFITEGEEDAAALRQAIKDHQKGTKWEHLNPSVISLRNGSSGAKREIASLIPYIRNNGFKEVVLCFDMDEQGQKARAEVLQILPSARTVALPEKDANECLLKGKSSQLATSALFRSSVPKNTRIIWGPDIYAEARKPAEWGLDYPWEGLTKLTRGIRAGETIYIGSGVKMGKGEVRNSIIAHLMLHYDMPVFVASPEETPKKTAKLILSKLVGKFFHDPNMEFDFDAYDEAAAMAGDKLCLLDVYQVLNWDTLRTDIQTAAAKGCKAIFVDPISNLTAGMPPGEADTLLQGFTRDLSAIAKDLNLITFIFCHLKAPESGPPHERGGEVYSNQFRGSRAMMQSCNYMIALEGNKAPMLPLEDRNTRKLVLLEDREFGASGYIRLYWDHHTGLFSEIIE